MNSQPPQLRPMHISVVIPTFNRAHLLSETLPALLNQQTSNGITYEVIFVSNGSSDGSRELLDAAAARHPALIRHFWIHPSGGPSAPRNVGIRAATGEVVVLIDDDVRPDAFLVQHHAEFHQAHPHPHQAAVGETHVPEGLLDDPMSVFHYPYDEIRHLDRVSYVYFWTCNVSVKRTFMLEKGMFDERFLGHEDVLLGHQLDRAGMHLHFHPAARGDHLHHLRPSNLATRGLFLGRWIYEIVRHLPEPAIIDRFGVLSAKLGPRRFVTRLARRVAFRAIDNPLTHAVLRRLGATDGHRSRASDLYYYLELRRSVVAGYSRAKREARSAGKSANGACASR